MTGQHVRTRLVDVWQHTTTGDSSTNKRVKLLVATNRQLQVTGSDTLHAQVLRCITGKFKHLCSEVLKNGRCVHCSLGTDADVVLRPRLEVSVDTTNRELVSIHAPAGRHERTAR